MNIRSTVGIARVEDIDCATVVLHYEANKCNHCMKCP